MLPEIIHFESDSILRGFICAIREIIRMLLEELVNCRLFLSFDRCFDCRIS